MSTDPRRSLRWLTSYCLGSALYLAELDVGLSLLPEPARYSDPFEVPIPLAASALVFLTLSLIWAPLIATAALRRRSGLDVDDVLAAVAVLLGAVVVLTSIAEVSMPSRPRDLLVLGLIGVLALLASMGSYTLLAAVRRLGRLSRAMSRLAATLPLLSLAGLALLWFSIYGVPRVASLRWFAGLVGFSVVVGATLWAATRLPRWPRTSVLNGALLTLVLACATVKVGSGLPSPGSLRASFDSSAPRHVFLLTVDTLRADKLSCYEGLGPGTPHLDSLARQSYLFRNAISEAPWTVPAFTSIMTGLPVAVHKAAQSGSGFPKGVPTLAQYLSDAGYRTAAIGANDYLARYFTLSRGFSEYRLYPQESWGTSLGAWAIGALLPPMTWTTTEAATEDLTQFGIDFVRRHSAERFFLWLHYFDPHLPYSPKNPPPANGGPRFTEVTGGDMRRIRSGYWAPTPDESARIEALYDAELQDVDRSIGRLLSALRELEVFDDALIVFTSDHGEEFFEHGGFEHGHSVYQEVLRVPLLVKLPRQTDANEVTARVSTTAVMPTVLELLEIPPVDRGLLPGNLLHLPNDEPDSGDGKDPLFVGGALYYEPREGVIFGDFKYVRDRMRTEEELFDLLEDPGEHRSLAYLEPDLVAEGRRLMDQHLEEAERIRSRLGIEAGEAELSEETLQRLRALGYLY